MTVMRATGDEVFDEVDPEVVAAIACIAATGLQPSADGFTAEQLVEALAIRGWSFNAMSPEDSTAHGVVVRFTKGRRDKRGTLVGRGTTLTVALTMALKTALSDEHHDVVRLAPS